MGNVGPTTDTFNLELEACRAIGSRAVLETICTSEGDRCYAQFDMQQVIADQEREFMLLGTIALVLIVVIAMYLSALRHHHR